MQNFKQLFYGKMVFQRIGYIFYRIGLRIMNFENHGILENGEANVLKILKEEEPQPLIFDVGANVGLYVKAVQEVFQGRARIYAFEPSIYTFNKLRKNTEGISSYPFGFGSKNEKVDLYYTELGSGHNSVYDRQVCNFKNKETVELRTIDSFCFENNIKYIDLLKIDVEGNELEVLKGAKETIIKNIQFEFGGTNIDSRTYFRDFWNLLHDKYNIYRIVKDGICEIKEYSESANEIFTKIDYFARLK
jgi:FkbM family methyltransferase